MDNINTQSSSGDGDTNEELSAFDNEIENIIANSISPPDWFDEQHIQDLYQSICDSGLHRPQADGCYDEEELTNAANSYLDRWITSDPERASKSPDSPKILKSPSSQSVKVTKLGLDDSPKEMIGDDSPSFSNKEMIQDNSPSFSNKEMIQDDSPSFSNKEMIQDDSLSFSNEEMIGDASPSFSNKEMIQDDSPSFCHEEMIQDDSPSFSNEEMIQDDSPFSNKEEQIQADLHQHQPDLYATQNQLLHETTTRFTPWLDLNSSGISDKESVEMDSTSDTAMSNQIQNYINNKESHNTTTNIVFQPIYNYMPFPAETFHRKLLSPDYNGIPIKTDKTKLQSSIAWPTVDANHKFSLSLRCKSRATSSKPERSDGSAKARPRDPSKRKHGTSKKVKTRAKKTRGNSTAKLKNIKDPTKNIIVNTLSKHYQNSVSSSTSEDNHSPTVTILPSQNCGNHSQTNRPILPCDSGLANASHKHTINQNQADIDSWTCHTTLSSILTKLYMHYGPIKVDGKNNEEKLLNLIQLYKNQEQKINKKSYKNQDLIQSSTMDKHSRSDLGYDLSKNRDQTTLPGQVLTSGVADPFSSSVHQILSNTATATHDLRSSLMMHDSIVESTTVDQPETLTDHKNDNNCITVRYCFNCGIPISHLIKAVNLKKKFAKDLTSDTDSNASNRQALSRSVSNHDHYQRL